MALHQLKKFIAVSVAFIGIAPFAGCPGNTTPSDQAGDDSGVASADAGTTEDGETPVEEHPDVAAIVGTWEIEASEENGEATTDPVGNEWTFEPAKLRVWLKDFGNATADYRLDPDREPKRLTLEVGRGDNRMKVFCIYEIEGDDLRICLSTKEPPDAFATAQDDGRILHKMRRIKDS